MLFSRDMEKSHCGRIAPGTAAPSVLAVLSARAQTATLSPAAANPPAYKQLFRSPEFQFRSVTKREASSAESKELEDDKTALHYTLNIMAWACTYSN